MDLVHRFWCVTSSFCIFVVKLNGKLEDGTIFLNKGYNDGDDDEADLFEFKTDGGNFNFPNVSPSHHNLFLYQLK